jgi:divalent metal cation (Fe/Co/Zn/Cd) transporter
MKRWSVVFIAVLMIAVGVIWFFQGIGVLPGSFMTGDPLWAWVGGIVFIVGLIVLRFNRGAQKDED